MSEMDPAFAVDTRMAVEFLLVWMERDQETATLFVDAVLSNPNGPGVPRIIAGQLSVGAALVRMLAEARGAVTDDDKRTMAREILRGLANHVAR